VSTVGFLHPGAMGASIAAACGAADRLWCSEARSAATFARAEAAGLTAVTTLDELAERSDVILAVCPPEAAEDVAAAVRATGFDGIYVDANAVAPETARRIGGLFARFVDAAIVGPPVAGPHSTRLYLAGPDATTVASMWERSALEARVLEGRAGTASALKVAYAAWTKGSSALLLAVRAYARAEGVDAELITEWALSQPGLEQRSEGAARGTAPKAWRFEAEMREIAAALAAVGLPSGFHEAAAEIDRRLAGFKDRTDIDTASVLTSILDALG